jgi:hypothetical protein
VVDAGRGPDRAQHHLQQLAAAEADLQVAVLGGQLQRLQGDLEGLQVVSWVPVVRHHPGPAGMAGGEVDEALERLRARPQPACHAVLGQTVLLPPYRGAGRVSAPARDGVRPGRGPRPSLFY